MHMSLTLSPQNDHETTAPESVTVVRAPAEAYWLDADLLEILITREQSGGAYDVVRTTVAPGGGPPPHRHRHEDELFYIVDGTFQFLLEDRLFIAIAGQSVFLPRGSVHTFRNIGQTRGTLIVVTTPSGFADFVADAGVPAIDHRSAPPAVSVGALVTLAEVAERYGIEIIPGHQAAAGPSPVKPPLDLWVMGLHVRNLLGGPETGGQFAVAEISAHVGDFVPPHLHQAEGEMFYVLEGTVEFDVPPGTVVAEAGTLLHIPKQTFHGFRNAAAAGNAKMLNFHTPAGFEKFFEELGARWPDPGDPTPPPGASADVERFIHIARAHGMELAERT
jgi:quercetin dioxygenase-like cupin family protein